ncbi:DUF4123 domain-containing protein [Xenorhabdus cabanillasii]|uniref:DUF4123 domain-containing protein n=1 Tax=Xenorhabdus cabanillasii JM26 TaxID=1427517 RepID=W1IXE2_9GAMM|nr:DUF4123 domain-containing protein [Xenorhabdus cabanillasii]PHM74980.1 hypothetical protein Xcab_04281 [Xenorhabdus cabanillasii JM26]CDL82473.1 conserved hypothetical protein [Xenorhabdus cabanillasii JM26]
MTPELQTKWAEYRKTHPDIKQYALVNGLQYERYFSEEITYIAGVNNPLFRRWPDAKIAFAGPWLFDMAQAKSWEEKLSKLEQVAPSVSWLHTTLSLDNLIRHLESYLNIQLETGKMALFRFYDPRILHQIRDIFSPDQLVAFTNGINEWVYSFNSNDYFVKGGQ